MNSDSYGFFQVMESTRILGFSVLCGEDTPYMGYPHLFIISLSDQFPNTPPNGCGILAGLINSRIHPNIYTGREQDFNTQFVGENLTPEQKEMLAENNGRGVKLCREETAGWNGGRGWTPVGGLITLANSFMYAFNTYHPLKMEPAYESYNEDNDKDLKVLETYNDWVRTVILSVYSTENFWEKMYSPHILSPQMLIAYFGKNADKILANVDKCDHLLDMKPMIGSPYVSSGHGAGGHGRFPSIYTHEAKSRIHANFERMKAMANPRLECSLPADFFTMKSADFPLSKDEMVEFMAKKTFTVMPEFPTEYPSLRITSSILEENKIHTTERLNDMKEVEVIFSWRPISEWSEKYKWTFLVWKLEGVEEREISMSL